MSRVDIDMEMMAVGVSSLNSPGSWIEKEGEIPGGGDTPWTGDTELAWSVLPWRGPKPTAKARTANGLYEWLISHEQYARSYWTVAPVGTLALVTC